MDYCPKARMGTPLAGTSASLCRFHEEERALKVLSKMSDRGNWSGSSQHPSVRALLGTSNEAIIQMAEHIYQGEWTLAPSLISHHQDDECMRELWQELGR